MKLLRQEKITIEVLVFLLRMQRKKNVPHAAASIAKVVQDDFVDRAEFNSCGTCARNAGKVVLPCARLWVQMPMKIV